MKLSQEFRKRIAPDLKKSELCIELGISRSTLNRWLGKEQEKFRHLDVIKGVEKILGIGQEEMFEEDKETANAI